MRLEDLRKMKEDALKNKDLNCTNGYDSPIQITQDSFDAVIEDKIIKIVQEYDISIDKGELIKALQYDRQQFSLGYGSGWEDGFSAGYEDCIRNLTSMLMEGKDV